jgi:hypothetical protein
MNSNTEGPYQMVANLSMSGPETASWTNFNIGNGLYIATTTAYGYASIFTSVGYRGESVAHNTMGPYQAFTWIVKT